MTEGGLLAEVLILCKENDILAYHSYDSRRDHGKGFPDLVLAGKNNILFAELKASGQRPGGDQVKWKYRITAAGGNWVWWTPEDLESGLIESTLVRL